MSATSAMRRRLSEPARSMTMELAEGLMRSGIGAGAIRTGIHYEAYLRRRQRHYRRMLALTTGHVSEQQRWALKEAEERARLAPNRRTRGSNRPAVFWHGPDRVSGGGRRVLVLVNGWTASGLLWPGGFLARLEAEFDVVRIDNRGTGYSRTAPAPFTIAEMADDVADVLREIGADTATVVGLSMGGMIAQEMAIRHPQMVEQLVLCATRPPTPAAIPPARAVLDMVIATPRPDESRRDFLNRSWSAVTGPGFHSRCPEAIDELIEGIRQRATPRSAVVTQMRAIASWHGASRLSRITVPTIVIHGDSDRLIPVGNGMRLAQLIPDATYVELPGVGHIVPFEAPDALFAAISAP